MNREIFRIAIPNIISNITVPLMGLISTGIIGDWSGSAAVIGALALGVSIFNFIYFNCSFIRMGTSGLTAQAYGAGNFHETTLLLVRAIFVTAALSLLVLILQRPLGEFALWLMEGDEMVAEYFYARIWAVPAGVTLFALYGWFVGMQNATIPMAVSICVNLLHIVFGWYFVYSFDLGISGIAYASVASQWIGVVLAVALLLIFFRRKLQRISFGEIFDMEGMKRFFKVNGDIVIRTFCNVCVYTFFTAASARMGNAAILAVNTILMQLLMLFSYMNDGFAYAAEALTGRFIGAKNLPSLKKCLRYCSIWTFVTALLSIALYLVGWEELFSAFLGNATAQELADVMAVAREYLWWIVIIPIFAALPFMLDGVMAGATLTRVMRNTMLVAASIFFVVFFALKGPMGNDALWLAFTLYIVLRLILQYFMSDRLRDIYRQIENFAK